MYHQVSLCESGIEMVNLALAYPNRVAESQTAIAYAPTLQTLWQYGFRFCIEELFLVDSRIRTD